MRGGLKRPGTLRSSLSDDYFGCCNKDGYMKILKACFLCACLLGVPGELVIGQENPMAFLSPPGEQNSQPTSGNTVMMMNSGETATI